MDTNALLDLETRTARISATLDCRPEIGAVWRQSLAIIEAGSSLSLEDIAVPTGEIVSVLVGETTYLEDPQSVQIAKGIYTAIARPGRISSHPGEVFDRAHRAGRLSSLVDQENGGRASYARADMDPNWKEARAEFVSAVPRLLKHPGPIYLKAVSVASLLADISPERHPIAERIVMMASESELRRDLILSDPITTSRHTGLSTTAQANWTMPPSVALSTGGFRAWSPSTAKGMDELLTGLHRAISREAGRIGQIAAWAEKVREVSHSERKKTPKWSLERCLLGTPLLTANMVATDLGCSNRTARRLLNDAEEQGLVHRILERQTFRVYAIQPLRDLIGEKAQPSKARQGRAGGQTLPLDQERMTERDLVPKDSRNEHSDAAQRLDEILGGLDKIKSETDRILEKYSRRRRTHDPF